LGDGTFQGSAFVRRKARGLEGSADAVDLGKSSEEKEKHGKKKMRVETISGTYSNLVAGGRRKSRGPGGEDGASKERGVSSKRKTEGLAGSGGSQSIIGNTHPQRGGEIIQDHGKKKKARKRGEKPPLWGRTPGNPRSRHLEGGKKGPERTNKGLLYVSTYSGLPECHWFQQECSDQEPTKKGGYTKVA